MAQRTERGGERGVDWGGSYNNINSMAMLYPQHGWGRERGRGVGEAPTMLHCCLYSSKEKQGFPENLPATPTPPTQVTCRPARFVTLPPSVDHFQALPAPRSTRRPLPWTTKDEFRKDTAGGRWGTKTTTTTSEMGLRVVNCTPVDWVGWSRGRVTSLWPGLRFCARARPRLAPRLFPSLLPRRHRGPSHRTRRRRGTWPRKKPGPGALTKVRVLLGGTATGRLRPDYLHLTWPGAGLSGDWREEVGGDREKVAEGDEEVETKAAAVEVQREWVRVEGGRESGSILPQVLLNAYSIYA